jgi:hypothetical protein
MRFAAERGYGFTHAIEIFEQAERGELELAGRAVFRL